MQMEQGASHSSRRRTHNGKHTEKAHGSIQTKKRVELGEEAHRQTDPGTRVGREKALRATDILWDVVVIHGLDCDRDRKCENWSVSRCSTARPQVQLF